MVLIEGDIRGPKPCVGDQPPLKHPTDERAGVEEGLASVPRDRERSRVGEWVLVLGPDDAIGVDVEPELELRSVDGRIEVRPEEQVRLVADLTVQEQLL